MAQALTKDRDEALDGGYPSSSGYRGRLVERSLRSIVKAMLGSSLLVLAAPGYTQFIPGTTATVPVRFKYVSTCGVNASALSFGTITSETLRNGTSSPVAATLQVTCVGATPWRVFAGPGQHAAGDQRNMQRVTGSASDLIAYNLYRSSTVSPANLFPITYVDSSLSNIGTGTVNIYGNIPATSAAIPPTGTYSDTVAITVQW